MPQKTREQKIRAAARKHVSTEVHDKRENYTTTSTEKISLKTIKNIESITTEEAAEDKLTRHFFIVDFRKSLIITITILAFEVAVKFVQLEQLLARYLKI